MTSISATSSPLMQAGHSGNAAATSDPVLRRDSGAVHAQDFDEIFVRHREMVYRVCLRWLGHHHDAEDVAQETFRRAACAIQNWDSRRPIEPWLVTIAGNRCRSFLARRRREKVTTSFDGFAADFSIESVKDRASPVHETSSQVTSEQELISEEWLDSALNHLPEDQRRAFELIHRDEFSYPQAAHEMGRSVGTIKTWVHRARHTMQKILRRESMRHAVAASVASVVLMFGWFLSRSSELISGIGSEPMVKVDVSRSLPDVESFRVATDACATDYQLASLQAFTRADLRFDHLEMIPQGSIPVADWIEQTTPVFEQFQQGVAPMRRTIRDVMMLFSCRYEQALVGSNDAELSDATSSRQILLELQGSLGIS